MANEVTTAQVSAGQRAIARFKGSFDRLRATQVGIFNARKCIGLINPESSPPEAPDLASDADGFLQQLEAIAAAFDEMTKEINLDVNAIAAAFK